MRIAPPCLDRMKQVIENRKDATRLPRLAPGDAATLFETVGAEQFRVSLTRWMPLSSFLWNLDNLRPAIREQFETALVRRCMAVCSEKRLGACEPLSDEENGPVEKEAPPTARPLPAEPACKPPANEDRLGKISGKAFGRGAAPRQDLFDRFVGWIAALVG